MARPTDATTCRFCSTVYQDGDECQDCETVAQALGFTHHGENFTTFVRWVRGVIWTEEQRKLLGP
jgi:hypothetical protein